jgi:opacity protein-like surface antigen
MPWKGKKIKTEEGSMKKFLIVAVAALLFMGLGAGSASAQGMQIDGTLSIATDPTDGFFGFSDWALGFGVGMSMDLPQQGRGAGKLQIRGDLNWYNWDVSGYGFGDFEYERIPVFVGVRYFIPMQSKGDVDLYVEGGAELSFDKVEVGIPALGPLGFVIVKDEVSDTNFGITPGIGIEIPMANNLVFGANARFHLITDSYLSLGATFGVKF